MGSEKLRKEVIGNATLYLGDCLDILPLSAQALITDPVWPNNSIPEFIEYDPEYLISSVVNKIDVIRAAFHLGCDSDPAVLRGVHMPFFRTCWLRYARPHYKGRLLYGADVAYLYGEPPAWRKGAAVIPGEHTKTDAVGRETSHPCERSLQHVMFLVDKWSAPGETVIDPFMGSGTTGVACSMLGRNFIGIEIDPKYHDEACERVYDSQNQMVIA